jgi:hypothetical protein
MTLAKRHAAANCWLPRECKQPRLVRGPFYRPAPSAVSVEAPDLRNRLMSTSHEPATRDGLPVTYRLSQQAKGGITP